MGYRPEVGSAGQGLAGFRLLLIAVLLTGCSVSAPTLTGPGTMPPPGAATGGPTAAPATAGPTPLPTATSFKSPQFGYTINVPAAWTILPATATWDGQSAQSSDAETVDQLAAPSVENRCKTVFTCGPNAWAYAAATTLTLSDLEKATLASDAANHPCPATPEGEQPAMIAGQPAILEWKHCPAGAGGQWVMSAVTIKAGKAYWFYIEDRSHDVAAEPADKADFLGLVRSITLPS